MLNTTYPQTLGPRTINGAPIEGGWQEEDALAEEIVEVSGTLDKASWRTLIAAIRSQLPVILTTCDRGLGRERKTVIVEYASVHANTTSIRVHYWGFGHEVYASQIVSVETPKVEYL